MKCYILKIEEIDTDSLEYREASPLQPLMVAVDEMSTCGFKNMSYKTKDYVRHTILNFIGREVNIFVDKQGKYLLNDIFRFRDYVDRKWNIINYLSSKYDNKND